MGGPKSGILTNDWPLVHAIDKKVLSPMGFRCFTVGRNVSLAEQTDDAVPRLVDSCECPIGIATERLSSIDHDIPDRTLSIATPYLLQETSMAFQSQLPFLMLKTQEVTLLGITNRNLWLNIDAQLHNGRPTFLSTKELVYSARRDLKQKALARRNAVGWEQTKKSIGQLSAVLVGSYGAYQGIDWLLRPQCFGN